MKLLITPLLTLILIYLSPIEVSAQPAVTRKTTMDSVLCRFYPFYFECPEKRAEKRALRAGKQDFKRIDPCRLFPYWEECGKVDSTVEKKFDVSK